MMPEIRPIFEGIRRVGTAFTVGGTTATTGGEEIRVGALIMGDVRLSMGGEPTFVSIDDPDGPDWNFTAVSPKKRVLSGELIKRLRKKFKVVEPEFEMIETLYGVGYRFREA